MKRDLSLLLGETQVKREPTPIRVIWKAETRTNVCDKYRVQAVIGENNEGLHAGVRTQFPGRRDVVTWGSREPNLECAAKGAEKIADHFLAERLEDLKHSASYGARLQARADEETLKPEAPRSPEEEQRMIGALERWYYRTPVR